MGTLEMIAFSFLLIVPWTCLAFEQPSNDKHFAVPKDDINSQSNNDDIHIEMLQMRVEQLEKENKLLEERLKKLEERDNLEEGLQKDYSTTEEVVFLVENHSEDGTENGYIPAGTIEWDFGIVLFNHWYPQGYSFSPDTGVFTAPINGLYIFNSCATLDKFLKQILLQRSGFMSTARLSRNFGTSQMKTVITLTILVYFGRLN